VKATDELKAEHEGIRVMLGILNEVARRLDAGETVDLPDLPKIVDFLSTFADRCHHGKEEDLLFPTLEKCGIPREGGPIGVMLEEHNLGREHIRAMRDALDRMASNDEGATRDFAIHARGYAELLDQHIEKEQGILFAMADQVLSPEQQDELYEGFEAIERERIGPGKHEEYHALLAVLAAKYLGT